MVLLERNVTTKQKSKETHQRKPRNKTAKTSNYPPEEDLYFAALNERESIITQHTALARTAYQRIYEVILFKKKRDSLKAGVTLAELADLWNGKAAMASASEKVNRDFIAACVDVYTQAFALPEVLEAVSDLEAKFKGASPFDKVAKMHAIVRKAKVPLVTFCAPCFFSLRRARAKTPSWSLCDVLHALFRVVTLCAPCFVEFFLHKLVPR